MGNNLIDSVLTALIIAAIGSVLKIWKDQAVIRRDIDALADLIGTKRAKARRPKADE